MCVHHLRYFYICRLTIQVNVSAEYCTADTKVSNLVPIIVGAALAGLVLIVLIAYLIGRSRNKRGYESV